MIVGIGVDIIEIKRIERACQKESFVRKVFSQREIEICFGRKNSFAGNFAVKEAVSKVFGSGVRGFSMTDIEVLRDDLGKPYVILSNGAKDLAEKLGIENIFVSISHSVENAVGMAVAER